MERRAVTAPVGTREQPCFSAERHTTQGTLRGIVRQANAPVLQESREGRPVLQQSIVRGLDRVVARHGGELTTQPCAEVDDQRQAQFLARGLPLGRRLAEDGALDVE
jgi:hypothetical protein